MAATIAAVAVCATAAGAEQKKAAGPTTYDVAIKAGDGVTYTGTMDLVTTAGKVSGDMKIAQPTQITGKPAGTVKGGAMKLDFAYRMVERACDGQVAMDIKMPSKPGAGSATGTVSITGCGRTEANKLGGTIDLTPQAPKKK